jgi:hypothetical protein
MDHLRSIIDERSTEGLLAMHTVPFLSGLYQIAYVTSDLKAGMGQLAAEQEIPVTFEISIPNVVGAINADTRRTLGNYLEYVHMLPEAKDEYHADPRDTETPDVMAEQQPILDFHNRPPLPRTPRFSS